MSVSTAIAPTSYNGHDTECLCVTCCEADFTAHIKATRTPEDAERLLGELAMMPTKVKGERTRFKQAGQRSGTGIVRGISDKQKRFIAFLLKSRDFSSIMGKPWFTTDVETISLVGARTFIDALLNCPELPKHMMPVDVCSDKQAAFIWTLMRQSEITGTAFEGKTEDDVKRLTRAGASKAIEMLKKLPKAKALTAPVATTVQEAREIAGLWQMTDGTIYRMKKARSGQHFYAELLTDSETGAFEYAAGMARRVPAEGRKMTLEECAALSELMGACCMCSRTLTATVNGVGPAGRFIGPICEAKISG